MGKCRPLPPPPRSEFLPLLLKFNVYPLQAET